MQTQTWQDAAAEIWQLFKETDTRFKELAVRFKETDARLDKRIKETDERFKETDDRFKETDARLDKRFSQTDRKINKLVGTFDRQWGRLIEALIRADAIRLFQKRGLPVRFISSRVKRELGGETMELDLMLLDNDMLVIIETKSALKVADVKDFLKDLADFRRFFPEYKAYHIYGGVAALEIMSGADRFAYRQGLFVLVVSGQDLVEIRNDEKFRPKDFGKGD